MGFVVVIGVIVVGSFGIVVGGDTVNNVGLSAIRSDFSGVAMFYSRGSGMFLVAG